MREMALKLLQWKFYGQERAPLSSHIPGPACNFRRRRPQVVAFAVKRNPKRLKYATPRFTKEDGLLYVQVDPSGSDSWKLEPVVDILRKGAVGVIPTDTVYAIACNLKSHSAIERLRSPSVYYATPSGTLIHIHWDFPVVMVKDIQTFSELSSNAYLYTFILTASKELPRQCSRYGTRAAKYASRKNVGVRMPDDAICQAILEKLEAPLISTSVKWPKENEWMIDPVVIADIYGPEGLDFVVDGGVRVADPSTVVDMTGGYPKVVRQGKGPKLHWMVSEEDVDGADHEKDVAIDAI
ncbi:hypothetical protein CDL15_Pgr016453 [Punica granatum]|uniref:Threonylcarbamoyl-AMP synthase n=1 Tax=Punica granatum TaxID=22663 RepID=A0A218XRW9_PUNGR|nr:hypothetical protein CDL15_Pgr016453 [Punica granatum]